MTPTPANPNDRFVSIHTWVQLSMSMCTLILALAAVSASASPAVAFTPRSVHVSGLTSRSDLIYLEAARVARGYARDMVTVAKRLSDSDADGAVDLPFGPRVPLHSLWIVVDLESGTSTVASPHPNGPTHTQEKLNVGQLRQLSRDGGYRMFLLVRPRVGAWSQIVADSGIYDSDGPVPDEKVKLDIERMQAVGDSPEAPRHLEQTDVVFVVDPINLTAVELRNE